MLFESFDSSSLLVMLENTDLQSYLSSFASIIFSSLLASNIYIGVLQIILVSSLFMHTSSPLIYV